MATKKTTAKKSSTKTGSSKAAPKKAASAVKKKSKKATTAQKKNSAAKKTTAKKGGKKTAAKKSAPQQTNAKVAAKPKKDVIKSFQQHQKDTGSPKVQVALLTSRINSLTAHLQEHKKDNHSRRGLILMVGKRRRLLRYINSKDKDIYEKITKDLKIRK